MLQPKLLALTALGCRVQSFDPLQADTVEQPGPHVFAQYYQSVHFRAVADTTNAPIPQPCARNDPDFPDPNSEVAPPPDVANLTWVVDAFCNTTIVTGFYVASTGQCPARGDMSRWPATSYINQYDAGSRLRLPVARDGRRGGNACGPSSLLMAMLQSAGSRNLPKLAFTYDETMRHKAAAIGRDRRNVFQGGKAVAHLKSLGWKAAKQTSPLGTTAEALTETILTKLAKGPVVISTAFGGSRWGVTGGGHMIAIVAADRRGNFIVEDPAGNFFASPTSHYGPGSCGHRAVYPHYWLLASTTKRWILELGKRTRAARPFRTIASRNATPKFGSAFAISDTHPGAADAPRSFYLQDAAGRRAGWIDGRIVAAIPNSSVAQDTPGWTEPAVGESIANAGEAPAAPRAIVVPELKAGTKLFVSDSKGARFSLSAETWQDGSPVSRRALTGTGTGAAVAVAYPR